MSSLPNVSCPYCKRTFKNEKLMLRHQTTSKTCLHSRGIKTESEASVEDLKNTVSELNHKNTALNEELKREKENNEILLNKISKLGNIMNKLKPLVDDIVMETLYKE
jgi:peptidoglycan hydrolase CwlO-like protein